MEGEDVMETAANGHPLGQCLSTYIDQGSIESHRYYLARRTLLEMLHDRGYVVPQSDLNQSLEEFRAACTQNPDVERLRICSAHRSDHSKRITDLLVNITKHVLKPKHRVLTEDEKQKLLKKYSIHEKQLPRMLLKDAIARYYGLEKGQVVKITHSGEITGSHVTYRCVW
ncbi:hypothetical protein CRG98_046993 [Punica granatum]|uniref:DNA-directed RNA polymerase V subunit 5A-like n=1 Tax=Punica granatum TaxID=22663 RepID=A0A2I0HMT0_PUNGR|nr:hypothetical protein CRG98_046993 [Punica granatum]